MYLKSAGSYEDASDTERDLLVCDENGFAQSPDLPYGVYTVKQTKGWEGRELMPAFDVFVSEDGQTYRYLINNAEFEALIEIVKKDAETGKRDVADGTLLPNAGFRIKDADGNIVVEGRTDENGIAKFTLRVGKYTYEEFDAPEGYLIDATPHEFEITENGQIVKAEMTDKKEPVPDNPKTGEDDNRLLTALFIASAGTIAGTVTIACLKKRKDEDEE